MLIAMHGRSVLGSHVLDVVPDVEPNVLQMVPNVVPNVLHRNPILLQTALVSNHYL